MSPAPRLLPRQAALSSSQRFSCLRRHSTSSWGGRTSRRAWRHCSKSRPASADEVCAVILHRILVSRRRTVAFSGERRTRCIDPKGIATDWGAEAASDLSERSKTAMFEDFAPTHCLIPIHSQHKRTNLARSERWRGVFGLESCAEAKGARRKVLGGQGPRPLAFSPGNF